ncbi:MAG: hypothetical protein GY913_30005 [Proteobacteria bacterium]|nr:hypothetical protein [Pseudomonadota bacterium]MCP4921151.1 hypothetical protein [Pseudomonadota bacterium]
MEHRLDMDWAEFAQQLQTNGVLRAALTDRLRGEPALWECAPRFSPQDEVRFVVLPSSAVASLSPDPSAFRGHFGASPVASFWNLGGDTRLVAPAPFGAYPHLQAFLERASLHTVDELWKQIGREILAWEGPLYLSTHGLGVPWLHVRLDPRPKYYRHAPYRAMA